MDYEKRYAELVAVQMEQWPDSRILTLAEVYDQWLDDQGDLDAWIKDFGRYRMAYKDEAQYNAELHHYVTRRRLEYQLRIARGLAMCSQRPVNVFYECGAITDLDEHGDRIIRGYRWRGCRYGTEGYEYISGFGKD